MAVKRARKSMRATLTPAQRLALFAPPQLLEGEDADAYDELLTRVCEAVKPADIVEEMLVADVISSQWEAWRWHRLKTTLLRGLGYEDLQAFLNKELDYKLYRKDFEQTLTEVLQDILPEDQADNLAENLARQCAADDPDAIEKVNKLLDDADLDADLDIDVILDREKAEKTEQLAHDYARKVPEAVKQVNAMLASDGRAMGDFVVDALVEKIGTSEINCLTAIERMDRLASIAEARRNASFREIDRHRLALGEALRRSLQTIEEGEFRVIEPTPVKGHSAA
jgi:hypothetical protein